MKLSIEEPILESKLQKEILLANYWEHFKFAKELALVFPIEHPKRKAIEQNINELQTLIK